MPATPRSVKQNLETVRQANDRLDCDAVLAHHPWFLERELDCVISPDADGQLCGLLLTNLLGWRVRGFYDGKALVVHKDISPQCCVFVDVEIYRQDVRSFGNHMLLFNSNREPVMWRQQFAGCFAINNWRNHDRRIFNRKYPFASIHFLLVLLAARLDIEIAPSAAGPLLFADGVYKLLLQYTENAWDWMRYMGVEDDLNPLHSLFHSPELSVYSLMTKMIEFWEQRDRFSQRGHRGDRIAITERGGAGGLMNLDASQGETGQSWAYNADARTRIEEFLGMLGELTGWDYLPDHWSWDNWNLYEFDKGIHADLTNLSAFDVVMASNPLSWAITASNRCEFTVDSQGHFPRV